MNDINEIGQKINEIDKKLLYQIKNIDVLENELSYLKKRIEHLENGLDEGEQASTVDIEE